MATQSHSAFALDQPAQPDTSPRSQYAARYRPGLPRKREHTGHSSVHAPVSSQPADAVTPPARLLSFHNLHNPASGGCVHARRRKTLGGKLQAILLTRVEADASF